MTRMDVQITHNSKRSSMPNETLVASQVVRFRRSVTNLLECRELVCDDLHEFGGEHAVIMSEASL